MQLEDPTIFSDVSDHFGIGNPAIAEKDYYVVRLLELLSRFDCEHYRLVFSGGTALAKANIKLHRMSEDVDIKLVIKPGFAGETKSAMRKHRKALRDGLLDLLDASDIFSVTKDDVVVRDEYRYIEIPVTYPQNFNQAPCLRPSIKLELIETTLLAGYTSMPIRSMLAEAQEQEAEVDAFDTVDLISTQAEKVLSMLRRTAYVSRGPDRPDDTALVRHIYDTYRLHQTEAFCVQALAELIAQGMIIDRDRYGNQHPEFVADPIAELRYGLGLIGKDPLYQKRYEAFVVPMVYGGTLSWDVAFGVFEELATQTLNYVEQRNLLT